MKTIKIGLPSFERIEIIPLADLHLGDIHSDFLRIKATLKYIEETPNAYCILNGDLMDCAIQSSIGDTYGANLQPMEQLKQCVHIFEPIKDKILCVTPGNHEHRIYKTDGLDITELMCHQLGIVDKYSPTTALLFIRFGSEQLHKRPMCYTAYVTHGTGGGQREGGKINRLADLANIVDADIYIHSHTHLPAVFKLNFFRPNMGNSSVAEVTKLFVNTASTLGYGGYGDAQGYKPATKDNPTIYLSNHKKKMTAEL